jgi:8-oxo-dGTP pyrophosphatase MutT (NUDIX family)
MNESEINLIIRKFQKKSNLSPHIPQNAVPAAVLLLLYPFESTLHTVLIKRVTNPKDLHSGQIGLPGGKFDPSDIHLKNTALRECNEEIGINPAKIDLIGSLTPLYIPVSNFIVSSFVGWSPDYISFAPDHKEVAGILEIPLSIFFERQNPAAKSESTLHYPHFYFEEHKIWGATALILNEFVEVVSN